MNFVVLSGVLVNIQEMTENIKFGRLEDEEQVYIIFWESQNFANENIEKKNINVIANIERLKIKDSKNKTKIITAYKVKELEVINDI